MNENINETTEMKYNDVVKTLQQWCVLYGLNVASTIEKAKAGLDMDSIINYRGTKNERLITYQGKTQNMRAWARELEIPYETLKSRFNVLHLSVAEAFTKAYKARS